jgi:hypothetical protein
MSGVHYTRGWCLFPTKSYTGRVLIGVLPGKEKSQNKQQKAALHDKTKKLKGNHDATFPWAMISFACILKYLNDTPSPVEGILAEGKKELQWALLFFVFLVFEGQPEGREARLGNTP